MILDLFFSPEYPPKTYILFLKIRENPVDLGDFMGVIYLHFSNYLIKILLS